MCKVEDCESVPLTNGYCSKHYQRLRRYGDVHFTKIERGAGNQNCRIGDCKRKIHAKGKCRRHYEAYIKYGDALHQSDRFMRRRRWIESNVGYDGEECLKWPFSVSDNGRGIVSIGGRNMSAPRLMCTLANGAPPAEHYVTAHSCGNGHKGCMNPRHLRWATTAENEADKVLHGTLRRGSSINTSKLSAADVMDIRRRLGGTSGAVLAKEYGVSTAAISAINKRRSWAWLK